MKRRRVERVERRRHLLELNLISETKPRMAIARRGCFGISLPWLLALAAVVAAGLGLR